MVILFRDWMGFGLLAQMLSHFKLAVADFERALERDPTNKEVCTF